LPPFFEHRHRIVYSKIENVSFTSEIAHPSVRNIFEWMEIEDGLEIHHDGDLPARSGLGSSSSFSVGLIHAIRTLQGNISSKNYLAKAALHVEQDVIKENVGSQDQISAAYGGLNKIEFDPSGDFRVAPVIASTESINTLESHLMLFFTGLTRYSNVVAQTQIDNFKSRYSELKTMHSMVDEGLSLLSAKSFNPTSFGLLLDQAWQHKRSLSDSVSNAVVDEIYTAAKQAGAVGGKLLGAGAGGFFLLLVRPEDQNKVRSALSAFINVPFGFENDGSTVLVYQPDIL